MFNLKEGVTDTMTMEKVSKEMKTRKLIAIGGSPGTGKTTLMRKFMEGKTWIECQPAKLVTAMYNEELDLYILGKYAEGETFAGTDRLSMAVQPEVQAWIQTHNCNVLFEGDRIFNQIGRAHV